MNKTCERASKQNKKKRFEYIRTSTFKQTIQTHTQFIMALTYTIQYIIYNKNKRNIYI